MAVTSPNVVPSEATVWYFIREQDFENIRKNFEIANTIAESAAKMTDTTVTRRIVGTAAPRHFNRPIAEATYANVQQVGLPRWTEDEQRFAKAVQRVVKGKEEGLAVELKKLEPPQAKPESGGSDETDLDRQNTTCSVDTFKKQRRPVHCQFLLWPAVTHARMSP